MSVTIRLSKTGKKNAHTFKVVVATTRDKRDGKALEILGYYNPQKNPVEFKINKEKYNEWKNKGAMVSNAVSKLLNNTYEFKKYSPQKDKQKEA